MLAICLLMLNARQKEVAPQQVSPQQAYPLFILYSLGHKATLAELAPADSDPATKWTMIAKCTVKNGEISQAGYLPGFINEHRQPEVPEKNETGQKVFDFVGMMTKESGLNTQYKRKGNEVLISKD